MRDRDDPLAPRPYHRISFEGFLDISRYAEYEATFADVPALPVLVDLTLVSGADSTFLSELLLFKRRHPGRVAVVVARDGYLARIFEIVDFRTQVNVYVALAEALEWIHGTGEQPSPADGGA